MLHLLVVAVGEDFSFRLDAGYFVGKRGRAPLIMIALVVLVLSRACPSIIGGFGGGVPGLRDGRVLGERLLLGGYGLPAVPIVGLGHGLVEVAGGVQLLRRLGRQHVVHACMVLVVLLLGALVS